VWAHTGRSVGHLANLGPGQHGPVGGAQENSAQDESQDYVSLLGLLGSRLLVQSQGRAGFFLFFLRRKMQAASPPSTATNAKLLQWAQAQQHAFITMEPRRVRIWARLRRLSLRFPRYRRVLLPKDTDAGQP
jgi:hypothetical protein